MLGDAQWAWLEEQLRQPAELRLLVSTVQVIAQGHGWERWGLIPAELRRLQARSRPCSRPCSRSCATPALCALASARSSPAPLGRQRLIVETQAEGVVLLSGDRHAGGIYSLPGLGLG